MRWLGEGRSRRLAELDNGQGPHLTSITSDASVERRASTPRRTMHLVPRSLVEDSILYFAARPSEGSPLFLPASFPLFRGNHRHVQEAINCIISGRTQAAIFSGCPLAHTYSNEDAHRRGPGGLFSPFMFLMCAKSSECISGCIKDCSTEVKERTHE